MKKIAKDAHVVSDENGVWLFDEAAVSSHFIDFQGPARVRWSEVPELITWLVQQWAANNAEKRNNE